MKYKTSVIHGPNQCDIETRLFDCPIDCVPVKVLFSSICKTDLSVLSGSLTYYQKGIAKYPITTGHEWCGIYEDQPVTSLCILGCSNCFLCDKNEIFCNNRKEVGVVNHNGAHAEYIFVPKKSLLPLPEISAKWALVEPLAVVIRGINKIKHFEHFFINGYGSIGKLCANVLELYGKKIKINDPRLGFISSPSDCDVIIESSGNHSALAFLENMRGISVLAFGFEYDALSPGIIVSNENALITTLGSDKNNFLEAIDIMGKIDPIFAEIPFDDIWQGFSRTLKYEKIVLRHSV